MTEANSRSGFYCEVLGFELPQKVMDGNPIWGPLNYISVVGDPKYVVFNEKFPNSVASNWQITGEDLAIIYIGAAAGSTLLFDCMMPFAGKALKKGSEAVTEGGVAKAITKHVGATENYVKGMGYMDNAVGTFFIKRGLKKAVKRSIQTEMKKDITGISNLPSAKYLMKELREQLAHDSTTGLVGEAGEKLEYRVSEYVIAKNSDLLVEKEKKMLTEDMVRMFNSNGIRHEGAELTVETVDEYLAHSARKTTIDKAAAVVVQINRAQDYVIPMLNNYIKPGSTAIKELDDETIEKLVMSTKDMFPDTVKTDMAIAEIVGAASEGDPAAKAIIKGAEDIANGVGADGEIMKVKAASFLKSMRSVGITGKAVNPTTKRGAATLGLGLAVYGMVKLENMNQMRDPSECGTNTMCLHGYNWPSNTKAGMKLQEELTEESEDIWIELRGAEESGRFYLASPCRADLIVEKSECECREFYKTDKAYMDIVIEEWGYDIIVGGHGESGVSSYTRVQNTFTVEAIFPKESKDPNQYIFKYDGTDSITFRYDSEGEEGVRTIELTDGDVIDDPLVLKYALLSMSPEHLSYWVKANSGGIVYMPGNEYRFSRMISHNLEQGTYYKNCIKGSWWEFWKGDVNVDCIKIKANGYRDYDPNFCFEKKWDEASKAEAILFGVEMVAGIAAAAIATPETLGAGAPVAYCGASMAVSTAGAWALSGVMADDKWPNGINQ